MLAGTAGVWYNKTESKMLKETDMKAGFFGQSRRIRVLSLVTMLILCALLCGCKKKDKNKTTPTPEPTPTGTAGTPTEASQTVEAQSIYQFKPVQAGDILVTVTVKKYGTIRLKLFPNEAPKAVENFKKLAEQGCYDGVKFSRVVADYMIQSGTAQGYTSSIFGGGFEVETSDKLMPVRGALCMADTGEDGTNTSSFYIVQTKASVLRSLEEPLDARYQLTFKDYLSEAYNTKLTDEQLNFYYTYGGAPWLYGHQTVFGQVVEGFDVLDMISEAKVTSHCVPNPGIFIESIRVEIVE